MSDGAGSKNVIVGGLGWTTSAALANAVFRFLSLIIFARLLTPSELGGAGIAMAVIGLLVLLSNMGLRQSLVRHAELQSKVLHVCFTYLMLSSGLIVSAGFAASSQVASFFEIVELDPALVLGLAMIPIVNLGYVSEAQLIKQYRFKSLAMIELVSYVVSYFGLGLLLAMKGYGLLSLVAAYAAEGVVRSLILFSMSPYGLKPSFDYRKIRELLVVGGGISITQIQGYLANNGDNLIIGKILGATAVGLYGRAYQIMALPANLIGTSLDKVLYPVMCRQQANHRALSDIFLSSQAVLSFLLIPATILVASESLNILELLLGKGWEDAAKILPILACGIFFRAGYKVGDAAVRSLGFVYRRSLRQAVYVISVLGFSGLGALWYGIEGASLGVTVAIVINYLLVFELLATCIGIRVRDLVVAISPSLAPSLILLILYGLLDHGIGGVGLPLADLMIKTILFILVVWFSLRINRVRHNDYMKRSIQGAPWLARKVYAGGA